MKPCFIINGHDYAVFIETLHPVRNDLDADGSGRNILDGLMYRKRITQKDKYNVRFLDLPEQIMLSIAQDINPEYVSITILDPKTNRRLTKSFYTSTLDYGDQQYNKSQKITYYNGCSFDITER